jgi:hypothetical protein
MTRTREHEFNVPSLEWEKAVFEAAVISGYFAVYDAEVKKRVEFKTLQEGLQFAHDKPRALLYAVAQSGRHVVIPRQSWNEYAEFYFTITRREQM